MPNRSQAHTALVRAIRLRLGNEDDLVLWPMQPGGRPDDTGRPLRAGPVGMADLVGILEPHGRWFCLEVKTGQARASKAQLQWGQIIRLHGGFYSVVRSLDHARACLDAARRGATECVVCRW